MAERRVADHENSEWRKTFWSLVNRDDGGAPVPKTLTDDEMRSSWQQLDEHDDEEESEASRAMDDSQTPAMAPEAVERFEREAAANWDHFYEHFEDKFFKDRNYLRREFPELFDSPRPVVAMEVGCGAGNTAVPLLEAVPTLRLHAFDFSARAVEVMRSRPGFDESRCHAFVCDVSDGRALSSHVPPGSVDVAISVFALSALSPSKLPDAISAIFTSLAPGGMLLFRDYGVHDMTQARFVAKQGRKLGENFYARADGTRVFFFSKAEARTLFEAAGFQVAFLRYDTRILRNRKRDISMKRIWITGKFAKPFPDAPAPQAAPQPQPQTTTETEPK